MDIGYWEKLFLDIGYWGLGDIEYWVFLIFGYWKKLFLDNGNNKWIFHIAYIYINIYYIGYFPDFIFGYWIFEFLFLDIRILDLPYPPSLLRQTYPSQPKLFHLRHIFYLSLILGKSIFAKFVMPFLCTYFLELQNNPIFIILNYSNTING